MIFEDEHFKSVFNVHHHLVADVVLDLKYGGKCS
jgi:hypothetical protein